MADIRDKDSLAYKMYSEGEALTSLLKPMERNGEEDLYLLTYEEAEIVINASLKASAESSRLEAEGTYTPIERCNEVLTIIDKLYSLKKIEKIIDRAYSRNFWSDIPSPYVSGISGDELPKYTCEIHEIISGGRIHGQDISITEKTHPQYYKCATVKEKAEALGIDTDKFKYLPPKENGSLIALRYWLVILSDKDTQVRDLAIAQDLSELTLVCSQPFYNDPHSKPFNKMKDIALEGTKGTYVDIGNAKVSVTITQGNSRADITTLEKELQPVIDTLFTNAKQTSDKVILTTRQIAIAFHGLSNDANINPKQLEEFNKAINNLRDYHCVIDCQEQYSNWKRKGNELRIKYDGKLLSANHIQVTDRGRTLDGWEILARPIICEYTGAIKQISQIETKLLNVGGVQNSIDNTNLKRIIIRQIKTFKSMKLSESSFELDKIMRECLGTDCDLSRKKRRTYADNMEKILSHLTESGEISGYAKKCEGNGGKLVGYTIQF